MSYDQGEQGSLPMRVQARPDSEAERLYYHAAGLPGQPWPQPKQIAPGISPAPLHDLIFHGGKVVPLMEFQNVFLGGDISWKASDVQHIDDAIRIAMQDRRLNTVMKQYFHGTALECDQRKSIVNETRRDTYDEPDIQSLVVKLFDDSAISDSRLEGCIFNLLLPRGAELRLGNSSSRRGLGGYHGSVHIERNNQKVTLYYSANVYSERNGDQENGIAVFDQPWKNVVATLYHELNEFRTDADVNDAITHRNNDFLGWTSRDGREVGDQPIVDASRNLMLVFKQIMDTTRTFSLPVQLMYSNQVHGAEDPSL